MKNTKIIAPLFGIALLVGIYQINLLENTLNNYGFDNDLSQSIPLGANAQTWVENSKIEMTAYISHLNKETAIEKKSLVGSALPIKEHKEQLPSYSSLDNPPVIKSGTTNTVEIQKTLETADVQSNTILSKSEGTSSNLSSMNQGIVTNAESRAKCTEKCIVLTIGDSVMGDVYYSLSRQLRKTHPSWKVIDAHKVSSGLSNQTYYDWPQIAQKLTEQYQPHYIVVLMGTNDAQGIMYGNKSYSFGKDNWREIYASRTAQISEIIAKSKDNAYWIELPQVKDLGFNSRLEVIRKIHQEYAKEHFLPTGELLGNTKDPHFAQYRQNDGIHLNAVGSDKIAQKLVELMQVDNSQN